MPRFVLAFVLLLLVGLPASGQAIDNSDARKARLHANLLHLFPQLAEYEVTIGPFEASDVSGMEQGAFVINGQQVQRFLTDPLDTKLYMIAGGPFNAGMSTEELAALSAVQEREEAEQARQTHAALLAAIEGRPARGAADAAVTIVEFSDFQCPYCAAAADTLHKVMAQYPDQVRLVYVQFPITSIHPWAQTASVAALCAAEQKPEAFWTLHDGYFSRQRTMTQESLLAESGLMLADAGIDLEAWSTCAGDPTSEAHQRVTARIDADMEVAGQFGIGSTPGFFVNGYPISGARPAGMFAELIERALRDAATE